MEINEADGILIAEAKIIDNEFDHVPYPHQLISRTNRMAHLYKQFFRWVTLAFKMAGLNSLINVSHHK